MKRKALLFFFSIAISAVGYSQTTHTVINAGFTFSPSALTIQEGDEVNFDIGGGHKVIETDEESFNSLSDVPLSGGFSTPFGGGLLTAEDLPVGTHFYYCLPHVSLGMVGTIIVEPAQGCLGDFDGDLDIDISDFLIFNSAYGSSCLDCPEDISGNGIVDIADFIEFNSLFGSPCE